MTYCSFKKWVGTDGPREGADGPGPPRLCLESCLVLSHAMRGGSLCVSISRCWWDLEPDAVVVCLMS